MNGIIHNCTHKDSDSPTFRMTEDKMFIAIFNYIEHLFEKIKPKKLFFMAIDGVAPRAKMNQQRARRFRTALDAENARNQAIKSGIEMPEVHLPAHSHLHVSTFANGLVIGGSVRQQLYKAGYVSHSVATKLSHINVDAGTSC